jgi:hypothetical protein
LAAILVLEMLGLGVVASGGCYERVVGGHGLGTSGMQTHKPTEPGFLDRLLGPEPEPVRSGARMRVN